MKNLKKLISVVLCLAMMASFLVVGTSAASYPDVTEEKGYYAAVELLSALGILKGDEAGNFNPDAEIKRSEFAAVLCRALGQENAATSTVSKFDDVAADHWAVGYIGWAAGKGIVNGYGDGNFGPDKAVTYQEAVKMIMAALGYEKLAQNNGGYPYGYLSLAGSYGVTAGLSADPTAAASRSLVAALVYNALEAPLMDTSYYSSTEERYVIYDGSKAADYEERTILSQYLDIIKVKANVTGNYKTDSNLWKKNGDPMVQIDLLKVYNESDKDEYEDDLYTTTSTGTYLRSGVKVYEGATAAADFLGFDVDAYMFFNEDDNLELKAIIADAKSVETLDVEKDIVTATVSSTAATFEYWEDIDNDSKATVVDVAADAILYKNGEKIGAINGAGQAEFEALDDANFTGTVQFVGSKGEDFSKVFVTVYYYDMVESVDTELEAISFANSYLPLSKDERGNDKFVYNIYKDGEAIALEDVQEDDVLSVVYPGSDMFTCDYLDIYVSSEKLTGTVTGAKSGTNNKTFYIDKVEYTTVDANALKVGDAGTYFLTHDGKIFDSRAESSISNNYAFILKAGSTSSFGENTYQLRIFTKEGTVKTLTVASTLKVTFKNGSVVDEVTYKRANNGQDALFATGGSHPYNVDALLANGAEATVEANAAKRLITYTESNGEITKISFATTGVSSADLERVYNVTQLTTASYKPAASRFGSYTYGEDTKLFYAPVTQVVGGTDYTVDEDDVALMNFASLDEELNYAGYAYSLDKNKNFGAALLTDDFGFAGKGTALAVVISAAEGLNAEGEKATTLTLLKGGEVVTYAVDDDAELENGTSFANLATGDVIQIVLNGVDEISQAAWIYDQDAYALKVTNDPNSKNQYAFGVVDKVASSGFDLDDDAVQDDTVSFYSFDFENGCTLAMVDEAKIATAPNSAVSRLSAVNALRAMNYQATTQSKYVLVARISDGTAVDAVEFKVAPSVDISTFTYELPTV